MMAREESSQASEEAVTKPVHALFNAISSSKLRLVRLLIDGGTHVDIRNSKHQTPLLAACSTLGTSRFRGETRERVVKYLIEAGANVNAQDKVGRTPLVYAVITQAHASVVFDLVGAGADLWHEDASENCAFDYAVQRGDVSVVGVMVEAYKGRNSSVAGKGAGSSREKTTGTQRHKMTAVLSLAARKHVNKVVISRNKGAQKHVACKATQPPAPPKETAAPFKFISNVLSSPACPVISPQTSIEKQLCNLCKSVITVESKGDSKDFEAGTISEKPINALDLNLSEYDLSGLLYRRRSTGSLLGLSQQRHESIQRKKSLGITLEDLFSTTEINRPTFDGQSLFVRSRQTNTMVDISTGGLSVPVSNRARSVSVSLPPTHSLSQGLRFLGEQAFATSINEEHLLLGHELIPRPSEVGVRRTASAVGFKQKGDLVYTSDSQIFLADDCDDNWDDILVIPPSQVERAQREVTSPLEEGSSSPAGTGTSESGRSSSCSPPIPRIVLSDFVQTSRETIQQNGQD